MHSRSCLSEEGIFSVRSSSHMLPVGMIPTPGSLMAVMMYMGQTLFIPYQIASNFDKVLKLASTKRILGPKEYFFFEHDEIKSSQAQRCFDAGFRRMLEEDGDIGSSEDEESPLHCRAPEIPVGLVRMTSTSGRLGDINQDRKQSIQLYNILPAFLEFPLTFYQQRL